MTVADRQSTTPANLGNTANSPGIAARVYTLHVYSQLHGTCGTYRCTQAVKRAAQHDQVIYTYRSNTRRTQVTYRVELLVIHMLVQVEPRKRQSRDRSGHPQCHVVIDTDVLH